MGMGQLDARQVAFLVPRATAPAIRPLTFARHVALGTQPLHSASSSSVDLAPPLQRPASTRFLSSGAAACAIAVGCYAAGSRRGRRRCALAASQGVSSAPLRVRTKQEQAKVIEAALLQLFQDEEPDILSVRECLSRLAKINPKPNSTIFGEWIIFWASKEGAVDSVFGTGMTVDDQWLQLQEYLIRFTDKKGGRLAEAAEVIRRVGPFPNQFNLMKGTYKALGTTGLTITFDDFKDAQEKDVELKDGAKKKVVELNVIYSSNEIIAMQCTDDSGECDFFVLTPVKDMNQELNRLMGAERRRFFFN